MYSSLYSRHSDLSRLHSSEAPGAAGSFSGSKIVGGIGGAASAPSPYPQKLWSGAASVADPAVAPGAKRPAEALYHQSALGSHTIGQTEALFSTNSLIKHPRLEIASNLPVYPQRPGEKDCAHYMLPRTCKFGDTCKFDHPVWVPEGGIPEWKEGSAACPFYMKTGTCNYGATCRFDHPPPGEAIAMAAAKGTEAAAAAEGEERVAAEPAQEPQQ